MSARPRSWRIVALAVVASVLCATPPAAHPHVFIDYAVTVTFDERGPVGVRFAWAFDDMYSSMLFRDFTSRPKDALSAADIANLKKKAFDDTAKLNYFTDLSVGGTLLPIGTVTGFDARLDRGRIIYVFTVPMPDSARTPEGAFEVASFDHEFYISFQLVPRRAITVENGDKVGAACTQKKVTKDTSFFGPIDAVVVACTYGKAG